MFGGLGRCFEEDPFFRDPFAAHHEHVRQMMRSFSDPFGRDPFLSITDGGERTGDRRARQDSQVALRGNRRATSYSLMPFGGFGRVLDADFGDPFFAMDRMMSNMRNSMLEMQRKFDDLSIHPDAHTFSSSSVMTYSKTGDEPPKVFQASAQTRTAPGGLLRLILLRNLNLNLNPEARLMKDYMRAVKAVEHDWLGDMFKLKQTLSYQKGSNNIPTNTVKETRRALKDSESGLEKMAIGHHIHDRAHVIEKSKNSKTGNEEMNQEFINLDETEAQTFDEEWQNEIMKFKPSRTRCNLEAPKYRSIHHIPKEGGIRREKPLAVAGSREPRVSLKNLNVKGTHVPIRSGKK